MPPPLQTSLLLLLVSGLSLLETQAQNGVFDVKPIDIETCSSPQVCATLYFYDEDYNEIAAIQGTRQRIKHRGKSGIRGVRWVRQVGHGCYELFKGSKHNKDSYELRGQKYERPEGLRNTVKSVVQSFQ